MTTKRRKTFSLPADVAVHLEQLGERRASAYVTEAVRAHMAWEQYRAEQQRRGVPLTREGMDAARARRYAGQVGIEERYAALEAQDRARLAGETDRPASAAA